MNESEDLKPGIEALRGARRRMTSATPAELVTARTLEPGRLLPLVIEPAVNGVDLCAWAERERSRLDALLVQHGAILFRGFGVWDAEGFARFSRAACGELIEYRERSSPRSDVVARIYTSTDYPADQRIFPHNEHSYARTFPRKILLCCLIPAEQGGETPLVDCRAVYRKIDARIRERFARRGWMYVRNFGDGFGLSWQIVFQTTDRAQVEEYCRRSDIEFEWRGTGGLRTRQVRPAIANHPVTGEPLWFNHLTFFHVSTLPAPIRDALLADYGEEDVPNNTFYGDGSPIEPEVLAELRRIYLDEMVLFPWQTGDVLVVDNMLAAHAREPFTGERKVLFSMAEPTTRTDF